MARKADTKKIQEQPWQVQAPKERFSEVNRARPPKNLFQFFRESPLVGVNLDLERDKDESPWKA